jgi:CMP/dCMP kinase
MNALKASSRVSSAPCSLPPQNYWQTRQLSPLSPGTQEQLYHQALRRVVETAANTGNAVIVGRAGQVLLAKRRDVLHVRIVAPFEQRLHYVMQREGLDEADARARIQQKDRDRSRHLQSQYHRDVNDPLLYDLVLNSGVLDLESLVDLIILAFERKARRLVVKTSELGAVVGLTPYPGRPADLHPPLPASATESEQST